MFTKKLIFINWNTSFKDVLAKDLLRYKPALLIIIFEPFAIILFDNFFKVDWFSKSPITYSIFWFCFFGRIIFFFLFEGLKKTPLYKIFLQVQFLMLQYYLLL